MRTLRLSFLASTFKLTLGLAKAKLVVREFKLYEYLTYICMRPMAIALNCCVKKYTEQCTLDIRICEKKPKFTSVGLTHACPNYFQEGIQL